MNKEKEPKPATGHGREKKTGQNMTKYMICLLRGDGIGPEVVGEAVRVLQATSLHFAFVEAAIGYDCYQRTGTALPEATITAVKQSDSALFGAVTTPPNIPYYQSPIVALRKKLDLYINLRPSRTFPGIGLSGTGAIEEVNLVIFRENTEGLYAGIERLEADGTRAITERIITRQASERIIRAAFLYAEKTGRKSVTVVHKANIMRETCGLFLRTAQEIAKEFPGIHMNDMIVDATTMQLIRSPKQFEVIVTTNMFGDILADEVAALVGGLGLAASGNIGDRSSVFEPVHGSAPKYAGTNRANPLATIRAAQMMLEHLGEAHEAGRIERAVFAAIADCMTTPDLGGPCTMSEATDAVIARMDKFP